MRWSRAISTLQASAIFVVLVRASGNLGKDFPHLVGAAQVERVLFHTHAVGVVHIAVRLNAQQHVVRIGILAAGVVPVVRGNQRQIEVSCQLHELPGNFLLPVHAVVLDFDVEVIRAKQIAIAERQFPRLLLVTIPERPRNLARRTTRKANETLVILLQQFVVCPRLVVEAFQLRLRRQLDEILVALVVFRQQRKVVLPVVQLRLTVEARAGRHVHLAAQDGLNAPFARFFIELDGAVKYAVIGESR